MPDQVTTETTTPTEALKELPDDELGLNIDMLDVDRLRQWAHNIDMHGYDLTRWTSLDFLKERLTHMANALEKEIVEVGELRRRLAERDTAHARIAALEDTSAEFVAYWLRNGGCGMCGGVPHSTTCFVGRIAALLPPTPTQEPGR